MTYERSEHKVMKQIRDILALADNIPEGDPEREVALNRANRLMTKHAIDQATLDATRTLGEKRTPTSIRFEFMEVRDVAWEWLENFRSLMTYLAHTNRVRAIIHAGTNHYDITLVGMQEDVEWVQLLWMRIFLDFASKVQPKWVPGPQRTVGHNVAVFKAAGYKWADIWRVGKLAEPSIDNLDAYDPKGANYLMREYRRHIKMTGEQQIGTQKFEAYRYSFVQSFVTTVNARLEQMRREAREQVEKSGSAVALVDVSDRVDEEFFRLFPSQRPLTDEEAKAQRERWDREDREREEKDRDFLASLSEPDRKKVLDERAKKERADAKANDKYWTEQQRRQERLHDGAGYLAGRTAGKSVDLNRGGTEVGPEEPRKQVAGS